MSTEKLASTQERWMDDLGYYVKAVDHEYRVDFDVWEVVTCTSTSQPTPLFGSGHDDTATATNRFLHGEVRWDGCSNWHFDEQDEYMLHFCSARQATEIGVLLGRLYKLASNYLPQLDPHEGK